MVVIIKTLPTVIKPWGREIGVIPWKIIDQGATQLVHIPRCCPLPRIWKAGCILENGVSHPKGMRLGRHHFGKAAFGPAEVELASEADFAKHKKLIKGYIGPWSEKGAVLGSEGTSKIRYFVDPRVVDGSAWVTGANEDQKHVFNLVAGRDFTADGIAVVSNGTAALHVGYRTLGIKPGDEIITASFTFIATAEVIALLQLKPVFVDVDPKTFCLDPKEIEKAITPKYVVMTKNAISKITV